MSNEDTIVMWECTGPNGEHITVTSLETQAVKAWAEGMLLGGFKGQPGEEAHVAFTKGFLVAAATASDEDTALAIAHGRMEECRHGDRPLMATVMTSDEAVAAAAHGTGNVKRRSFRRW